MDAKEIHNRLLEVFSAKYGTVDHPLAAEDYILSMIIERNVDAFAQLIADSFIAAVHSPRDTDTAYPSFLSAKTTLLMVQSLDSGTVLSDKLLSDIAVLALTGKHFRESMLYACETVCQEYR